MLDTGASLTFMEERMLSRLGLCSDDLVPLSSVGIPPLVVADGRPMPVVGVVSSLTLSLGALPPCSVRVVVVEHLCGADLILGSDFLLANGATVFLGSEPPCFSFFSGTLSISFDEIKPPEEPVSEVCSTGDDGPPSSCPRCKDGICTGFAVQVLDSIVVPAYTEVVFPGHVRTLNGKARPKEAGSFSVNP